MNPQNQNAADVRAARREFAHRAALAVFITVVIVGLLVLIGFSIDTWFVAYLGVLLAIFIRSLSDWLARHTRLSAKWSVLVTLLVLLGLVVLGSWWLAQPLIQEAHELEKRLPQALAKLRQQFELSGLRRVIPTQPPADGGEMVFKVMNVFTGTVQSIVGIFVVIFLGIYLAFSPEQYVNGAVLLVPQQKRERARAILHETGEKLRYWIFGQLVSMVAVGAMIAAGLYFAGIPVPLVLGIIAGLLDIVPIFGPIIAAAPAILLGFTVSPMHALYVVIVFVVANQIESHLLVPIVQRYSIRLPPALTVFALLLMGSLFGFLGVLLAAPITATILVLVQRIYLGDVLHDAKSQKKEI